MSRERRKSDNGNPEGVLRRFEEIVLAYKEGQTIQFVESVHQYNKNFHMQFWSTLFENLKTGSETYETAFRMMYAYYNWKGG